MWGGMCFVLQIWISISLAPEKKQCGASSTLLAKTKSGDQGCRLGKNPCVFQDLYLKLVSKTLPTQGGFVRDMKYSNLLCHWTVWIWCNWITSLVSIVSDCSWEYQWRTAILVLTVWPRWTQSNQHFSVYQHCPGASQIFEYFTLGVGFDMDGMSKAHQRAATPASSDQSGCT